MKRFSKFWIITVLSVTVAMAVITWRSSTNDKAATARIGFASECSAATAYICADSMTAQNIRQSCQEWCLQQYQSAMAGQMDSCYSGCQKSYNLLWSKGKTIAQ